MPRSVALCVGLLCLVVGGLAECQTTYDGICPGSGNCRCVYGGPCSAKNRTELTMELKERLFRMKGVAPEDQCTGMGGVCLIVESGRCQGPDSCLYDTGNYCNSGPSANPTAPPTINPTAPPPASNPVAPPSGGGGSFGIDASGSTPTSVMSCLKSKGVSYLFMRVYHSYGAPDQEGIQAVSNARQAGIGEVGGYLFPNVPGGNAAAQVQQLVSALGGVSLDVLWLDIEQHAWSSDQSSNQQFFTDLMTAAVANFGTVGVYSSASQWNPIFGSGFTKGGNLPLWYADYDGQKNFGDFQPFGGWSSPSIKQYAGNSNLCGANADLNWRP